MWIRSFLSVAGVFIGAIFQVAGVVTYLLFWRIDNEPGVAGDPLMFAAAVGLVLFGLLLFFGGIAGLIVNRAKAAALVAVLLVAAVAFCACAISPMVLILMV
jgi:hypothetical protein